MLLSVVSLYGGSGKTLISTSLFDSLKSASDSLISEPLLVTYDDSPLVNNFSKGEFLKAKLKYGNVITELQKYRSDNFLLEISDCIIFIIDASRIKNMDIYTATQDQLLFLRDKYSKPIFVIANRVPTDSNKLQIEGKLKELIKNLDVQLIGMISSFKDKEYRQYKKNNILSRQANKIINELVNQLKVLTYS